MYLADAEARTGEKLGEKLDIKVRPLKEVARKMYEVQGAHRAGVKDF